MLHTSYHSSQEESLRQDALLWMVTRALRVQSLFSTQFERLERFLAGFSLAAFDQEHRSRLTAEMYSARGDYQAEGLFDWERSWFKEDLPPPPARILVGGAGTGRETLFLLETGYEVVAFDPATSFAARGKKHTHPRLLDFCQAAYEDLIPGAHQGEGASAAIKGYAPYDAILFGWGSFTHVSDERAREQVLAKCRSLCPQGPLLMSFWMRGDGTQRRRGKAWEIGWRMGQTLAPGAESLTDGDDVSGRAGFGHFFTLAEIENLSAAAGYNLARTPSGPYQGTFPHATLNPAN